MHLVYRYNIYFITRKYLCIQIMQIFYLSYFYISYVNLHLHLFLNF